MAPPPPFHPRSAVDCDSPASNSPDESRSSNETRGGGISAPEEIRSWSANGSPPSSCVRSSPSGPSSATSSIRASPLELEDLPEALALELLVADGEDLVEEKDVRVDMRRDRETEPHVHPGRIRAYGQVDEFLQSGERDDLVELLADVCALEPVD